MVEQYLISICIPSYNRPLELKRLLDSIDSKNKDLIQIVICEDKAPKRLEVGKVVEEYKLRTIYHVKYIENVENFGHGKNLRACIQNSDGEYVLFMGDDDMFIPDALDTYIEFLKNNKQYGYILRSYRNIDKNGKIEYFKYYNDNKFFEPGEKAYTELFLKSVFMSGFTIKTEYVKDITIDIFDPTLLFQLYLVAEVCMKYPSAYFRVPITQAFEGGVPFFGSSENEKELYTPGTISVQNSLNFMRNYFNITSFMDKKYSINSTSIIKRSMSKYSYPVLSIQRNKGIKVFINYSNGLRQLGFDCTFYYEIYYWSLLIFGRKFNDLIIRQIKRILGKRPNL